MPSIATIVRFFFDPTYGLFVLSPILIVSLFGLGAMKKEVTPAAFAAFVLSQLSTVLIYAGYPNWDGGWSVGPRYILSIVPFLAFAILFAKPRAFEPLLLGYSTLVIGLTSLVFPFVPSGFAWPWGSLSLPLLTQGLVAPNLLHFAGRPAAIAVCFIPAAIALVAATGGRIWIAVLGAVIATAAAIAAASYASPLERIQRAYIADVYFERTGALERSLPPGFPRGSPLFHRRELERTLPPGSWPF
ncbi:MAG TPA: hypothetical protein VJ853_13950 [Thermoanaerobaculia bacterium]|nr:hypothetical protein [Thermoanaerobaculia bacterium]